MSTPTAFARKLAEANVPPLSSLSKLLWVAAAGGTPNERLRLPVVHFVVAEELPVAREEVPRVRVDLPLGPAGAEHGRSESKAFSIYQNT